MSGLVRNSAMQTNAIVGKPVISTVAQVDSHKIETPKFDKDTPKNASYVLLTNLASGAVAGAVAKTFIAPLDRTKINFQISTKPYSTRAAFRFLKRTYVNEGFLSLYRGNSATMVRIVPYAAIQFGSHEQFKKLLQVDKEGSAKIRRFMAGSLAGITSQTFTYPLDFARARLAITKKDAIRYHSLREVFVKVWAEEGPRAFLRGYWATVLGVIPYAGTSFFTYGTLRRKHKEWTGVEKTPVAYSLVYGAVSGIIGQTTSYPLDIVRRRMQTASMLNVTEHYETIFTSLKNIYRTEGIFGGYFKGLSMNWIKGPMAVGISFTTFEFFKDYLQTKIPHEI